MSKGTLLLVDDDRQVLASMADWLRSQGYELDTAQNCQQARAAISNRDYNVALVDVRLPDGDGFELLAEFRETMRRWQAASVLPVDQLILTLGQDLFDKPADLALTHKLAIILRAAADAHPDWRLPELTEELASVARNQRRFIGLSDEDAGFDPEQHRGQVVVATMHKAKGLEWDRVYLMAVNNYNFPSAQSHDTYIAERWFIRDGLNLEMETVAQLKSLLADDVLPYAEGEATRQARLAYVAERLRLLYVGITRAKRVLIITWNSGRPQTPQRPAVPFIALKTYWEK